VASFQQALIFAGLADEERTLEALDRMAVVGPVRMGWILGLPELALIRGDPRRYVADSDDGGNNLWRIAYTGQTNVRQRR